MRLEQLVEKRPGLLLAFAALLTLAALAVVVDPATGRSRLRINSSIWGLLPEDSPEAAFLHETQERFGKAENLVMGFATADVFRPEPLRRLRAVTRALEALPEIRRVTSLSNAVHIHGEEDGIRIGPFVEEVPETPEALATLRAQVLGNPFTAGSLVSPDGSATALLIELRPIVLPAYAKARVSDRILEAARAEAGDAEIWLTGGLHLGLVNGRVLLRETALLPALILGAMSLVLLISFRTVLGVLVPLVTVSCAVLWTLALTVLVGHVLNAVTVLVPALLTTVGLAYAVHVVSEFYAAREGAPARRAAEAVGQVRLPVLLTALTTAIGFGSLMLAPIPAVRQFGALAVMGVVCATVAALTLTPGVLAIVPARGRPPSHAGSERLAGRVARFAVRRRGFVFGGFALCFGLSVAGAASIRVGSEQITKFPEHSQVRRDFKAINDRLGGANPLLIVLSSETPGTFKDPEVLGEIEALQTWLRADPGVGVTTSLVDHIKLLNRAFHEDDPEWMVVPSRPRMVSQLLLFGDSPELRDLVDVGYQRTVVKVRASVIDTDEITALTRRIEERLLVLPGPVEARVTGSSVVVGSALDEIVRGQTISILTAIGIIYLVLSALFVSLRVGVVALLPNLVPLGIYFGALGWTGISLSPGTSLIAPMVLGIAVDDTIHYFARFIREARRLGDEEAATVATLAAVGPPVTVTTAALCAGFLCLFASDISTQREIGTLAAFALFVAWLTDVLLTPALCAGMRIVTLWDLVRLDLGENPSQSIGLFHGLRTSQARIVALMGTLIDVPAGRELFRAGEPAAGLFVVIGGRVRTWLDEGDAGLPEVEHTRGDLVGEAGLSMGEHITHAAVVEDARVLRLSQRSMDQIGRRYPAIAAVLFRNTNRVLAGRLALQTQAHSLDRAFHRTDGRLPDGALSVEPLLGDAELARSLATLRIRPDTVAALALIPLVQVAWADGRLDEGEREAILAESGRLGVPGGTPSHALLTDWLRTRPDDRLYEAWKEYVQALSPQLTVEGRLRLRESVMSRAEHVARAAGGVAGVATVSRREGGILKELAAILDEEPPSVA